MGRVARRRAASFDNALRVPIEASLRARFLRRYKRFLADVVTEDGRELTVHCPNPGSMLGFHRPGAAVRCSTSDDPHRKLRHTLEMMRVGRVWVGLHALRANAVAARALGSPAASASATRGLARPVCSPTQVRPMRIISSVWRSLRFGFSLVEQRTAAPGRMEPRMLPGLAQWTVRVPASVSTSAKKRL